MRVATYFDVIVEDNDRAIAIEHTNLSTIEDVMNYKDDEGIEVVKVLQCLELEGE